MNKKKENKRLDSTKKYIDALQDKYSKINVVRVDLAYKKPHSEDTSLEDANTDITRMMNNRRSKPSVFKNQIGYVMKKEYTEDKGCHIHAAFIYDGQKVKKDSHKADQIGEYQEEITKEKGSYHNCNKNKYDKNGVGIIDHTDEEKREILDENVLSYLCKDDEDQDIEKTKEDKDTKTRAFTRGTLPKDKSTKGRPRKKTSDS